jgi:hypothetical protein
MRLSSIFRHIQLNYMQIFLHTWRASLEQFNQNFASSHASIFNFFNLGFAADNLRGDGGCCVYDCGKQTDSGTVI